MGFRCPRKSLMGRTTVGTMIHFLMPRRKIKSLNFWVFLLPQDQRRKPPGKMKRMKRRTRRREKRTCVCLSACPAFSPRSYALLTRPPLPSRKTKNCSNLRKKKNPQCQRRKKMKGQTRRMKQTNSRTRIHIRLCIVKLGEATPARNDLSAINPPHAMSPPCHLSFAQKENPVTPLSDLEDHIVHMTVLHTSSSARAISIPYHYNYYHLRKYRMNVRTDLITSALMLLVS
ncbi:SH3 domain-binding glutamic acid-rich protein isoform X3 [Paramormyrops kingsleyae]|uniref:SH3 domain-binding glutamic acid-rich protein isoform X3 n=1 Tax=Paramormyrops kingsleyae TaxID=1676925 RepID=UPI003B97647F